MKSLRSRSSLEWVLVTSILIAAAVLRFHDLGNIPRGLEHDEVATWHMVDRVLAGERVIYFEEGYGHEPLFNYLTALPTVVWGANWLGERFWAPWFGLFAVAATYALLRRLFGPLVGLAAAGFQGTVLWALFFNRLGLRLNLLPFLLCVTLYCFWRGYEAVQAAVPGVRLSSKNGALAAVVHDPRPWWFAAAGLLGGLCLYTYMSSRAVPLILGTFTVYLLVHERWLGAARPTWPEIGCRWWPALVCVAVAAIVAAPLFLYLLQRPAEAGTPQREGQVDRPLRELRAGNPIPVLENAWGLIKMWNVDGERYWQLNYAHRPVFVEPIGGVLFWVGLLVAIRRWREPRMALLLIWIGLGMVPSLLTSEAPSWPRTMLASPAALALPGIAVAAWSGQLDGRPLIPALARFRSPGWRRVGAALLAASLILTCMLTYRDFLILWPRHPRVRYAFQSSLTEALRYLDAAGPVAPTVIAGLSPHDMDPWTELSTLRRRDLDIRWIDIRSALIVPPGASAQLIVLDITPLSPVLSRWAGLEPGRILAQGQVVPRGGAENDPDAVVTYSPAYTVYDLDAPALWARAGRASTETAVGADPFHPTPLADPPQFGTGVRLVGYEWLAPPSGAVTAELLTYWLALDEGPRATRYGEPAQRIFCHLLDHSQQVVASGDALGAAPDTWQKGDLIVQLHSLAMPDQAGTYALEVGWFVPPDGPRLPVQGVDAPDARVLLEPVEIDE